MVELMLSFCPILFRFIHGLAGNHLIVLKELKQQPSTRQKHFKHTYIFGIANEWPHTASLLQINFVSERIE